MLRIPRKSIFAGFITSIISFLYKMLRNDLLFAERFNIYMTYYKLTNTYRLEDGEPPYRSNGPFTCSIGGLALSVPAMRLYEDQGGNLLTQIWY